MTSPRWVAPVGLGIITASAPVDITQWAIDCSTYCSVLPVNRGRAGSACMKQAEMPIFRRDALSIAGSYIASSNSRSKSAAVQGRGLVRWQMSATAISTSRGICAG